MIKKQIDTGTDHMKWTEEAKSAAFVIGQGPSDLDLRHSLFSTPTRAPKIMRFQISDAYKPASQDTPEWLEVRITHARTLYRINTIWDIEGIVQSPYGKRLVVIQYQSDTRNGRMWFKENLLLDETSETDLLGLTKETTFLYR